MAAIPPPDSPPAWREATPPASTPVNGPPPASQHPRQAFEGRRFRHRNEATRDRDVLRYIQIWEEMYRPAHLHRTPFAAHGDQPLPAACPDSALAAFAQLAVIRMRAQRCLVTLTSAATEWVLADCGPSTSLQDASVLPSVGDRPWIGTSSFPRPQSFDHIALDEWRKARRARDRPADKDHYYTGGLSEHAFIIEDLRHGRDYQHLDMVRYGRWIRFHCAVPLRDAMGSVLGSLTVLDDKPRYGVSVIELTLLEDLSDTVVEHMFTTLARARRQRGERLIASLGLFHAGENSLREWWLAQDDSRVLNTGRNVDKGTSPDRQARVDAEFGTTPRTQGGYHDLGTPFADRQISPGYFGDDISLAAGQVGMLQSPRSTVEEQFGTRDWRPDSSSDAGRREARERQESGNEFNLAQATTSMYKRVSNILREALGADGVAIMDPGIINDPSCPIDHSIGGLASDGDATSELRTKDFSDNEASDSNSESPRLCKVLGSSIRNSSTSTGVQAQVNRIDVPEHCLQHLIKRSREGFVCHFDQQGQAYSSSDESGSQSSSDEIAAARQKKKRDYQRLGKVFHGVKVLSVYPLWDEGYSRSKSCILVWTASVGHFLDQSEDLMFLKTFGNSMSAELSRLESIAADMSKATFISSISHELRSPLHGILAGAEFLHDTPLTDFQQEMTHAISMAGRTLLDTVNHVLDYSKIKGPAKAGTRATNRELTVKSHKAEADDAVGASHTDLARLTEEVVESMVTAHRLHDGGAQSTRDDHTINTPVSPESRSLPSYTSMDSNVSISLTISHRKHWIVEIQPGGWTRILTNLVGNAIKYTSDGYISVRLSVGEPLGSGPQGSQRCPVQLSVEDTGIGMSDTFLAHGVFTPFKQENPHADGTGLGLSIVQHIARSMGADLEISSNLGEGTLAQIQFFANFVADDAPVDISFTQDSLPVWIGDLRVDQLQLLQQQFSQPNKADSILSNSVSENARQWLRCEIIRSGNIATGGTTSICGVTEQNLVEWQSEQPELLASVLDEVASKHSHLLVFGQSMRSMALSLARDSLPVKTIFIHQPIGPRKLLRAIASHRDLTRSGHQTEKQFSLGLYTGKQTNGITASVTTTGTASNHEKTDRCSSSEPPMQKSVLQGRSSSPTARKMTEKVTLEPSTAAKTLIESSVKFVSTGDFPGSNKERDAQGEHDTLLLVEDNEVNMKLLIALVTKLKVPYKCAVNGFQAVQIYTKSPSSFFLILMDMSMPVMDGFAATAKIQQEEKRRRLERTFVMALTGVTDMAERKRALDGGIDEFHNKPIRMKQLKEFIDAARQRHGRKAASVG